MKEAMINRQTAEDNFVNHFKFPFVIAHSTSYTFHILPLGRFLLMDIEYHTTQIFVKSSVSDPDAVKTGYLDRL